MQARRKDDRQSLLNVKMGSGVTLTANAKGSTDMRARIAVLPGDGIGQEVVPQGVKALQAVARRFGHQFDMPQGLIGGVAIGACGHPLPPESIGLCTSAQAILFGAVGDPRYPAKAESALLLLRKHFDWYMNIRPIRVFSPLIGVSPVRPHVLERVDYVILREITSGPIYGRPKWRHKLKSGWQAVDTIRYREGEVTRFLRCAFELARIRRKKLTLANQENLMETSRLWCQLCREMQPEYPDVHVEYLYADTCAMELARHPSHFDVIAFDNMIMGGMLNDAGGAAYMGSMGMPPSASIGPRVEKGQRLDLSQGVFGLYEPVHGSAPQRAGQGIVNPIATVLSVALLLRLSLGLTKEAETVERAVERVLEKGYRTYDIMEPGRTKVGTTEMGDLVAQEIEAAA